MSNSAYDSKLAIPNKLLKEDGTITDLTGQEVGAQVDAYRLKPAIPDKVLNADGTYSKLSDIIGGGNIDLYVIVDELPATGDLQKIYLVPNGSGGFDEYRWTGTKWDPIGMLEFDLTDYSTTEQMNAAIATSLQAAKDYADSVAGDASSDANAYTDNAISASETTVKAYADTVASTAQTNANSYTDTAIQQAITNELGGDF